MQDPGEVGAQARSLRAAAVKEKINGRRAGARRIPGVNRVFSRAPIRPRGKRHCFAHCCRCTAEGRVFRVDVFCARRSGQVMGIRCV